MVVPKIIRLVLILRQPVIPLPSISSSILERKPDCKSKRRNGSQEQQAQT